MTAETTPDATIAAEFVGPLWTAIRSADGPRPAKDHHHLIRGLFDAAWLGSLPLLVGKDRSEKQSVALGSAMQFERHPTSEALDGAYAARPRTRIYEGYDARTGGWPAMVTRILMRLADCRVV
ncbi:MAG TPA: hypothetical protein VLF69_06520, partial [Candidatus Saccharimonadales bacterium]|nr:hypothetical protein [Candidatus Saccharimonadales bacterium]